MKLLQVSKEQVLFHLNRIEKDLLVDVLKLYPRIPSQHQPLSQSASLPDPEGSQRLLDEALAEERSHNKQQLQALLEDTKRLAPEESGWRLSLSSAELEWLLQILNDIRVGSWLILGSPEEQFEVLNEQTAPHVWAMELAGSFQMVFLEAMRAEPEG